MKCYKCGDGIESGKSFIPVDRPGTPNRRWACTNCADLAQKSKARKDLGKEGVEMSRLFDPELLK